jgi:hypothetical protein
MWLAPPRTEAECRKTAKSWLDEGSVIREDEFLFARLPEKVTRPAKALLEREGSDITAKIFDESFEWWYGQRTARWRWSLDSVRLYWVVKNDNWPIPDQIIRF